MPTLFYPIEAAEDRGAVVEAVHWPGHPTPVEPGPGAPAMVADTVGAVLEPLIDSGAETVVVAKSLGTLSAPAVAARECPAIWVTPVLTEAVGFDPAIVVEAVRKSAAPCLLVGGTGDDLWDGDLARSLTPHVLEVPTADHGLRVPGPLADSAAVLGQLGSAVERFLDEIVWPG